MIHIANFRCSRIELQPTASHEETSPEDLGPSLELRDVEAPPDPENVPNDTRRNRRSRILSTLNIGRMRHATPQERLEALRILRQTNASNNEDTTRNRFSRRFSRALNSRPPSAMASRPTSEIPPGAAGALDAGSASGRRDDDLAPPVDTRRAGSFAG